MFNFFKNRNKMIKHKMIIAFLNRELKKVYLKHSDACPDSGGCGLIADFIYEGFKSLGYNPRIQVVTCDYDIPSIDVRNSIQDIILSKNNTIKDNLELGKMGVRTTHVMIKFYNHYIDLGGCYKDLSEMKDCHQ